MVLSFPHSIYQLHLVQKCMSCHKLSQRAWVPCTNLGTWKYRSSSGNYVSILKSNLEISGGLAVLATFKWSTGKRCPSWYLSGERYFADTHLALEGFRLAWHHVQAKYTKLMITFCSGTVSHWWGNIVLLPKKAQSTVVQPFLLHNSCTCWFGLPKSYGSMEPLEISPTVSQMEYLQLWGLMKFRS